jgi:Glycosyl hydrolase family 63 C-terminal domain
VLSIFDEQQLMRLLKCVFDPDEFLSDFGIRSLSKVHAENPFRFGDSSVHYEPGESENKLKGGNSNWRGPVWFPTTFMIIESLKKLNKAYGPDFRVNTIANKQVTFDELAREIADRLIAIFTRNAAGIRPVFGNNAKFQNDPHWRDYILFYEYFNGDTGEGLGASHQTGWTGLVATLIDEWRR